MLVRLAMKGVRFLFVTISVVYLLSCALLFIFQRDFLYFPTPKYDHPYQSEVFHHDNESIEVIMLNKGQEKAIIYFGGNGEAVVHSASDHLNDFPNHTIYLVNYRGYGGSSGRPDEDVIYSDALHIYDKVASRHQGISVMGRSLGSGVATYIGANREIDKMALITPYDSIESIAKTHYPLFPISLLLIDRYDSIGRVKSIQAQTLIIVADNDTVIPLRHSQKLIDAFPPSQIKVVTIRGSGHNNLSNSEAYHSLLKAFM